MQHSALKPEVSKTAAKHIQSLDKPTRSRIKEKIRELCRFPFDIRISKPLVGRDKRSARVGAYRILFIVIDEETLFVADVGPRGQVYRDA